MNMSSVGKSSAFWLTLAAGTLLSLVLVVGPAFAGGNDKVEICHFPPGNPDNYHTITVSENAVATHIERHGDLIGSCEDAFNGVDCPCFDADDIDGFYMPEPKVWQDDYEVVGDLIFDVFGDEEVACYFPTDGNTPVEGLAYGCLYNDETDLWCQDGTPLSREGEPYYLSLEEYDACWGLLDSQELPKCAYGDWLSTDMDECLGGIN